MGLYTSFVAHPDDRRIEITGSRPFGRRLTGHTSHLRAAEMLAWSRWQLGWLDESQVLCLTADRSRGGAEPGGRAGRCARHGRGAAVGHRRCSWPRSGSRSATTPGGERPHDDGAIITVPALATEGLLVYTVDASLGSGQLPLRIAGDAGNGQVDDYPILKRGDQVVVRGYTVTFVSDRGGNYIVAVSKTAGSA